MILFHEVNKCFKQKNEDKKIVAIDNCSFHIPQGIVTGIIGKSGSGKTTLLKLMCGLLQADDGRIRIGNKEPIVDRKSLSSLISVLFADKAVLNEEESVVANFDFLPIIYKCDRGEFLDKKQKLIQLFELTNLLEAKIRNLSLGQKRRVECAYTLMCPAELMVLDEPCNGMDIIAKQKFEQVIKDFRNLGKTVVISSHTMGEIDRLCDRVILLDKGKLIFYGGLNEIYHQFMPIDVMTVNYNGKIPDMQDIPLVKYQMDKTKLMLYYNTNIISAAEIIKVLMETTKIAEVSIEKPHLEEVILALK